ncbi:MAG: esterase [Amycolatopsis sp.]|jgi:acetyl esterase/lipase|uniref:alpha/beta hydrolase n=1 Tax=Amycolatopsis sp. TaxID=37632 RepID=UPI00262C2EA9|nr:alpha/beta hydrolase [Amycolatopsis sp.]MCU1683898.1 esterase [Amycolatopsis sp.]MDT5188457.1 acetyl esterase [Mycobacterium sp.]
MAYAFDPELAAAVLMLPENDFTDLPTTRARMKDAFNDIFGEPDTTGVSVRDEFVPGPDGAPDVRVRVYTPDRIAAPAAIVDVHGGGFIVGSIEADAPRDLAFARELGVVVLSVDYRLAPEAPFPAGLEDCYAALSWTAKHAAELGVDPARIAIHGTSAGGGLCAALALLARDRGGPAIAFQYLGVPEIDDRLETPSMRAFVDTPLWNRPLAELSWDRYLGAGVRGTENVPVYAAPARATDLGNLPPAYISAMEFDPLRDEGIAYAQALLAAGVTVELHLFPGTFHGSRMVQQATLTRRETAEATAVLARALGMEPG